jgi:predicted RNA-binding Zn ribbon-like protein
MASKPAPGELELVRAFVNTWDAEDATETFVSPEALRAWLVEHGVLEADAAPAEVADVERAIALRGALRTMLRANHGASEPDRQAPATLEAIARRARLAVRFGPGATTRREPLADGVDGALGRLLARVAAAMDDGTWRRLKICPADDCQWAFYDTSRNRSGVWCDMGVCGNRHKVRAFRKRQRGAGRAAT